jgi:hypothetical protein
MASLFIEKTATNLPVTLADMKNFLRVSITDDDTLISTLLQAATDAVESFTGRSLCNKGYRQGLDSFPYYTDSMISQNAYPPSYYSLPRYSTTQWNYSQMIKLFRPPLVSVDRISYLSAKDSQWHDLVPTPALWKPATVYALNATVMDGNGNVQKCSVAGTSDANPPVWNTAVGGVTIETNPDPGAEGSTTPVQWTNQGPFTGNGTPSSVQAQFGAFVADTDAEPGRVFPGPPGGIWPAVLYVPGAVQIHFTAGYGVDGTKVPAQAKMAIMQCVANWYENREAAMLGNYTELPNHCKMLLWSLRVMDMQPTRG